MRQLLKITTVLIVCLILAAAQGIAAPKAKGNNGNKDHSKVKTNHGQSNQAKTNHGQSAQARADHGKQDKAKGTAAGKTILLLKKQQKHIRDKGPARDAKLDHKSPGSLVKEEKLAKLIRIQRRDTHRETQKDKAERFKDVLKAMEKSRWAHHPHDERGQGNMSKNDMLDPFGHDKDSDRKALYGNNGRPIRSKKGDNTEEPPVIDPVTLEASIDFTSIGEMQWLVDWYESTLANYYLNSTAQSNYTYAEWEAMWHDHFFPGGDLGSATGIRLNNIGDTVERYSYDILLPDFEGDVEVTTQMILSQPHTTTQQYDETTGQWIEETIDHQAGEIVYETAETATVDSTTGSVNVGIAATNDLLGYSTEEAYIDLIVTITDPATGNTYTQSYDKALYLYRCPYGKIYDAKTNRPIVNASVTVHFEDGSIVPLDRASNPTASNPQVTDATGRYGFKLETNRKYFMTATADGYEDYKSPVFTEKWHVLREDIALTRKSETAMLLGKKD